MAALLVAVALVLAIPAVAAAEGVLDQSQPTSDGSGHLTCPDVSLAQTFTAGLSGGMDRVDIGAFREGPTTIPDLVVQIQTVSFDLPTGLVLAEETLQASSLLGGLGSPMVTLPLDPPVSVRAGTKYAIVLLAVGLPCFDGYGWQQADGSTYPAGEAFSWLGFSGWGRLPSDYMFKTYVDTALPGAYAFEGFFDPVMNPPALNRWPATKPLPIRFSLGGDQGLDVFDGPPQVTPISCLTLQPIGGSWNALMSSLVLGQDDVYQFFWNTIRRAAGKCRQLTVNLADGTSHSVFVRFGATAVAVVRADRIERGKAVQATVSVTCDPIPADSYAALFLTIFQGQANSPYYREGQGGVGLEGINGLICDGTRHTYSFTVRLTSFFVDKRFIPGEAGFEWVVQVCSPTVCSLAGGPTQGRVKIQP